MVAKMNPQSTASSLRIRPCPSSSTRSTSPSPLASCRPRPSSSASIPRRTVPALEAYLKDHGFTLSKSTDHDGSSTRARRSPVSLQTYYFSDGVKLEFTYQPQQPQAYKTFTTLPMTHMTAYMGNRELNKAGKKRAEIRKMKKLWVANTSMSATPQRMSIR